MTTLQRVVGHQAIPWSSCLTDSAVRHTRHIRIAELPATGALPAAPRLSAAHEDQRDARWFTEVETEMRGYSELVPNWDSYDGGPVRSEIVDAAVEIARLMAVLGFSRPHVCPESSGGVLLEWEHTDRALTVDLDGNEGFSFAYESPGAPELEGDMEHFVGLLRAGVQPF